MILLVESRILGPKKFLLGHWVQSTKKLSDVDVTSPSCQILLSWLNKKYSTQYEKPNLKLGSNLGPKNRGQSECVYTGCFGVKFLVLLTWDSNLGYTSVCWLFWRSKTCRVHWYWIKFLQIFPTSWWPNTSMWSRGANIREGGFAFLSNMPVEVWPLSHLPILNVAWLDWLKFMSWYVRYMNINPRIKKAVGKFWIMRIWHHERK